MLDESSVAGGLKRLKAKHWFLALAAIVLAADISILIDLPFFRQVLGFLCFTIIPGLLVLYILKLREMGFLKKLVLSIGLSLAFLIFSALLINTLLPLIGYTKPLSTVPLLVIFNILIAILFFLSQSSVHVNSRERPAASNRSASSVSSDANESALVRRKLLKLQDALREVQ